MKKLKWLCGGLLVVGALVFGGCAPDEAPISVSLANLAATPHTYDHRLVRTEGVVRTFDEPRHYWIEDEWLNRVAVAPHDLVAGYVGKRVRVAGLFRYVEDEGRRITLMNVEVLGDEEPDPL